MASSYPLSPQLTNASSSTVIANGFCPDPSRASPMQWTIRNTSTSYDPITCPREATVAALWEQLQEVRIIHVRGTPTSGKSTLANLLSEYVKAKEQRIEVKIF